ncbi:NAT10 [Bugula neritina]|uniref:NAT10 n=1 Tax=Bugula neritina TaxID=10212 RepID=A0A7J7KF11_BUGNE|nr:NAT10 [Bugula neritina]
MATLRKNIDPRIKALIENNVKTRMRSLFVVVGAKAKNQVAVLHELISTASDKSKLPVLWCYEKHLGMKK